MNNRDQLIDMMVQQRLERRDIAGLVHVDRDIVDRWLLPVESPRRIDVPDMAVELLADKLAQRAGRAIPCLQYRDAPAAIDWLCTHFGFTRHLVVPDDSGGIAHAQLCLGAVMIMVGSVRDNDFGRLLKQPDEIGGASTQSVCVVVPDADAVYAKATAGGAKIVVDIKDEHFGGRSFSCRDPAGHLWIFGTYDPWVKAQPPLETL